MPRTLSGRLSVIAPSATLAMNTRALKLREAGHKVFAFGVGEPDFPTPSHITEAAYKAALGGATRYTPVSGTTSLRKAIVDATMEHRGRQPTPDMVTVSVGAKHALFNLAVALYEPGDEVLIPTPYWVSYPEQVRIMGAEPVFVTTTEADGFRLRPEALEAAITPKTKALILCTPSNPTGGAYGEADLLALAEVLRRHDLWVIVDEIYGDLTYDGFAHKSLAQLAPDIRDRLIVIDGVSKTFAMTGWRVGWSISPPHLAKALDTVQGQSTSNASAIAQAAAEAALKGPRGELETMKQAFSRRRELMVNGLRSLPGVKCRMPEGAFYAFADFSGVLGKSWNGKTLATDEQVADYLLDEAHVVTVGGTPFGAPGYVRLSYAVSEADIHGGIEAMRKALERLLAGACAGGGARHERRRRPQPGVPAAIPGGAFRGPGASEMVTAWATPWGTPSRLPFATCARRRLRSSAWARPSPSWGWRSGWPPWPR
jgi:aspartate aminotransferase